MNPNPQTASAGTNPAAAHAPQAEQMLAAERDVQRRLDGRPLDFDANRAISNIYRAAAAVRRRAEQDHLSAYSLSWGGFTILWVLWVWGPMPTARLAAECDLAKGTLTGMLTTLEKQQLVTRTRSDADRRRVIVEQTPSGAAIIDQLFPRFNDFEVDLLDGLSSTEIIELSRLLRIVITNAESDSDASGSASASDASGSGSGSGNSAAAATDS